MRVALVDPSLFTLPYDRMLALGLRRCGHDVVLHGRALRPDEDVPTEVPLAPGFYRLTEGPRAPRLPKPLRLVLKGLDHLVSMGSLPRRLRRERPDVIHMQWLPLPVVDRRVLPALRRVAPLVLTLHDSTPFNGSPSARLQQLDLTRCFAAFDRLIVHTERFREQLLAQGLAPERVVRVPHGLLGGEPSPPQEGAGAAPAAGEGQPPPSSFLLFGHIKPYKGLDLLIEAFGRLPPALQANARLHVVGRPYMDITPLIERAGALGIGARLTLEPRFAREEEIPALFGPGTVAVFPYRAIEASGALTLAVAHGRPIIAARLGAFAEELVDGTHGLLVPPDDAEALAAAMVRMLTEPGLAARCAAHVRALSQAAPSWEDIGRRTTAVYEEAIAVASAPRRRGAASAAA
jgi:glycosyltransferase involved in cell wall biosynthesis